MKEREILFSKNSGFIFSLNLLAYTSQKELNANKRMPFKISQIIIFAEYFCLVFLTNIGHYPFNNVLEVLRKT